jgi:hypothetical protein
MDRQEALDRIAAIVDHHVGGAAVFKTDPDDEMVAIRDVLDQLAADKAQDGQQQIRDAWVAQVRVAADAAERLGGELGHPLSLTLRTAAGHVASGSNLGGGLMGYRVGTLAKAVMAVADKNSGSAEEQSGPQETGG